MKCAPAVAKGGVLSRMIIDNPKSSTLYHVLVIGGEPATGVAEVVSRKGGMDASARYHGSIHRNKPALSLILIHNIT